MPMRDRSETKRWLDRRGTGWVVVVGVVSVAWSTAIAGAQPDFEQLAAELFAPGGAGTGAVSPDAASESSPSDFEQLSSQIHVNEHQLVDLHVADESLAAVLQVLSIQSQRNILAGAGIDARITADLYSVTFYEALDALLHVHGYGYIERDGFIYVYTQERLAQMRDAVRRRISRVIELDYLNAVDAARLVAPLLSEDGTITAPGESPDFLIPNDSPVGKDDYPGLALLVVNDYPDRVDEIQTLVRQLGHPPGPGPHRSNDPAKHRSPRRNAFGVDFALIADIDFSSFVSPLDAADNLIGGRGSSLVGGGEQAVLVPNDGEGRALTTANGNVTGPATLKAGIIDQDVGIFLRLLDEVSDITVVSNPKLLTLNRQPGRVLVGTRVGFLNTTTTETATTQSVEFLDTGTQLHVRPFVTADNLIRLELKPQVSTFRPRATVTATGQIVTIPDEDTTELVTNLIVRDGQTVVLGGLFTETTTASRRQVPVLGDVPLIGAAFRGHDDSTARSEIIFLVTPSILNDLDLTIEGERATAYVGPRPRRRTPGPAPLEPRAPGRAVADRRPAPLARGRPAPRTPQGQASARAAPAGGRRGRRPARALRRAA
jgi:type IV pilus assembly protein PilQ